MLRKFTFTLSLLAGLFSLVAGAAASDKMTVLLDWFVNPDHATLVIAKEKGFFEAQGLDVELVAPADPNDPPKLVAAGHAELAVSYQPQLHLQVAEGLPLSRIGTLVATPLNSLVVLEDSPIKTLADLKGRKVGYSVGGFEDIILDAMLESHGMSIKDVELINVNFTLSPSLISGQVDAVIGAFRNFELNQMDIVGKPGRAFYVEEEGVPTYDELILVANKEKIEDEKLPRFLKGLEQATTFLINHPDESWKLFIKAYPDLNDELNKRAWKDTLPRFALRPAALDTGRYNDFAEFLKAKDMIKETIKVSDYAVSVK